MNANKPILFLIMSELSGSSFFFWEILHGCCNIKNQFLDFGGGGVTFFTYIVLLILSKAFWV